MKKIHMDRVGEIDMSVSYSELDKNTPFTHREIHMHEEYELLIPIEGEDALELDGGFATIPKNSAALIRPYTGHRCIFKSEGMHSGFWVLIRTDNDFFESLLNKDDDGGIICLEEQDFKELTGILKFIGKNALSGIDAYAVFFDMMRILKRGSAAEFSDEIGELPKDVRLALEYMEKHLEEKFEISDLAKSCHVSLNTLERHFREHLQLSPSATLKRKRLVNATKLLSHNMSVSEVCERCGFTDYSNFIVIFRKFYGMTPLKYQKSRQL